MSSPEVIQVVASCVRAFHNGADRLELLQARDARNDGDQRPLSEREKALAEILQKLLKDGGDAISNKFQQAQKSLGQHARLLQQGDDTAKIELLDIALQVQEEVGDKLSAATINGEAQGAALDNLQALYRAAMTKQMAAEQSILGLQQRIAKQITDSAQSSLMPSRRNSARSMARDFPTQAMAFSRGSSLRTAQAGPSMPRKPPTLHVLEEQEQQHLIPEIRADDIQSLAVTDWDQDDRYTMAPEAPLPDHDQQQQQQYDDDGSIQAMTAQTHSLGLDASAASVRAGYAPEAIERQFKPEVPMETAGPYFPPTARSRPHANREIPTLPKTPQHRPSLPESQMSAPPRMLSPSSIASGSSSPHISEPDSAISFRNDISKAYCTGAWNAQEDLIAGFTRDFLPTLPGSRKRELCWKCKECDFNFCDPEGQLLEGIYFEEGVRFRFTFLARAHVAYHHPEDTLKPSYRYGCTFCTAEGKRTAIFGSTEKLMAHIRAKHRTNLTPEVRERVRCIIGRSAAREEQWDCNLADIGSQGGVIKKFVIRSVTGLRS